MDSDFRRMPTLPVVRPSRVALAIAAVIAFILFLAAGPIRTVPAGNVGIKDFFGSVSASTLTPGFRRAIRSSPIALPYVVAQFFGGRVDAYVDTGMYAAGGRNVQRPTKLSGDTPMIVYLAASI